MKNIMVIYNQKLYNYYYRSWLEIMKKQKLYKNIILLYITRNYILLSLLIIRKYEYENINDVHTNQRF